jgi:hypothetical protein
MYTQTNVGSGSNVAVRTLRLGSHRGRLACLILTKVRNEAWPSLNFDIIRLARVLFAVEIPEAEYAVASVSSSPGCTLGGQLYDPRQILRAGSEVRPTLTEECDKC